MKTLLVLLTLLVAPSLAHGQRRYYYYSWDRNEISVGGGVQLDATGWEPAGMKLFFEYARRLGPHGAIVFQANPLVVQGPHNGDCHAQYTNCPGGFSGNGYSFDLLFGGKWRWHAARAPLLGTFDLTFGVVPLFERAFDDNGVAMVARAGGGLVVLLARHVGLRFDAHLIAGPAFLNFERCDGCDVVVHPYVAFDTGVMVEFIF
ncbi:MAG TPA: hypothetical protein VN947_00705 [Polyangia bacterium]|nr:hypothetical protein [Polyangia bacterium]